MKVTRQVRSSLLSAPTIFLLMKICQGFTARSRTGFTFSSSSSSLAGTQQHNTLLHAKRAGAGGGGKKKQQSSGFGSSSSSSAKRGFKDQTYGPASQPSIPNDIIDMEGAMDAFFSTNCEWNPLFRSFLSSPTAPASSLLLSGQEEGEFINDNNLKFHEDTPWKQLDGAPTSDTDLAFVASFLDSVQQSLLDIPVDEATGDDASDLHFIEEGRRLLVVSRFHVLSSSSSVSRVELFDELFTTCWSEMAELQRVDEADTGSLILLPDYNMDDLRRFADMNLHRPLDWLGTDHFEVTSMERGYPAIRILHKLSDIPTTPSTQSVMKL